MPVKMLKDKIILKAEKESLSMKKKAKLELESRHKDITKKLEEKYKNIMHKGNLDIIKKEEEEYAKKIQMLRRELQHKKKEYLDNKIQSIINSIPSLSKKEIKEIYLLFRGVIEHSFNNKSKITIYCSPKDYEVIKDIFKGYSIKKNKDIVFGILAVSDKEIIDLTLNGLRDRLEEKLQEMII